MTKKPVMTHKITPHLWFDKEAREAAEFYTSVFPKSKIKSTTTLQNTPSGTVEVVTIDLMGQEFMLLSAGPLFKFNESISFIVRCKTQKEIDYYWERLSAVPEAEQCGWLKDKYGLSWQIVPAGHGQNDEGQERGAACPGDRGVPQDEEVRHQDARAGI